MQGPGIGRRRQRLSDDETERRMLDAATAMVNRTGLTVSLDHISFEEVIRDAGVSRSTVYRRWPYKDLFFSDLLKELAKATTPAAVSGEDTALPGIRQVVLAGLDRLRTPEGRHQVVIELMRQAAVHEFDTMHGSTEWRTYLALQATFLSVSDEGLRTALQEALMKSEQVFVSRIARSWQLLTGLLGYRLRPEFGTTFETLAILASADLRGLVILALAYPEVGTRRLQARLFGADEMAEWSLPAIGLTAIAMALLEPDSGVAWDDERIGQVRETLGSLELAVS